MPQASKQAAATEATHPAGVRYDTLEPMPQGTVNALSPRGAPMLIMFSSPQRPRFGSGTRSMGLAASQELLPGQGPINRGY